MSDFFNGTRFARLLRAHWAESWRGYVWFAAVLIMLDLILMAICFGKPLDSSFRAFQFEGQTFSYTIGLFVSSCIFAGRYFKYLLNPGASLIALMRPASVFEKWLMAFLIISVLYPLAYSALYVVFNYPAVQLAKAMYVTPASCQSCTSDFRFYLPFFARETATVSDNNQLAFLMMQLVSYVLLSTTQALIAGGTAFFKRSPVLRTVLGLFLLFILSIWISSAPQLRIFSLRNDVSYSTAEYVLSLALWLGLPVILWAALFFHVKEREVA